VGQMERIGPAALFAVVVLLVSVAGAKPAQAQNGLQKVNHIIVVMQENHSFDNYLGALEPAV
jgi:phospholipase C